jgi:lysophospholipase L1-like esterase
MPLGGSITYGVGSSDGNGYRKALRDLLHPHNYTVTMVGSRRSGTMTNNEHEGWRGFRIDQIENKSRASLEAYRPNLVTVNAGSNDCIQDLEIDSFGVRLESMLEHLWSVSSCSTIVLSTLLVALDKEVDSRVRMANKQIRKSVEVLAGQGRRITLADMYGPGGPDLDDLIDGVHPNDLGYRKMADIWYKGVTEASVKGFLLYE